MKFLLAVSVAIVLGFLGFRVAREDISAAPQNAGTSPVSSRTDPARFLVHSQQDPRHNAIRQAAQTAANAYAASPCDPANKANLVKAFSEYVETAQAAYGCTICSTHESRAAVAAFATSLDKRVKAALRTAFSRGGIYPADLSPSVRLTLPSYINVMSEAQCSGPTRRPRITGYSYSRS